MPELPEVETVCSGLRDAIFNKIINEISTFAPKLREELNLDNLKNLEGSKVVSLERRAKYIVLKTNNGDGAILHLGMSGRWHIYKDFETLRKKHEHLIIKLGNKSESNIEIRYEDARRFGFVRYVAKDEWDKQRDLNSLGLEPLSDDFSVTSLESILKGKKQNIRTFLLNQSNVVGIGNIYVAEILWEAKVSPLAIAGSIPHDKIEAIVVATKEILNKAIKSGGTTLRDYVQTSGDMGYFVQELCAYGQSGKPCRHCGGAIVKETMSGRSNYFCPKCQS